MLPTYPIYLHAMGIKYTEHKGFRSKVNVNWSGLPNVWQVLLTQLKHTNLYIQILILTTL